MQLVFATHNQNKFREVQQLVPPNVRLLSLTDIECHEDIPETGKTLAENAQLKADYVARNYSLPCFADDTGLLVDALNGAPGIYSARYAGEQKNATENMDKLLAQLEGESNRSARFSTVIALRLDNENILFEGVVEGAITHDKHGTDGFGYDPIFRPQGYKKTFAELPLAIKNKIGHRGKATQKLLEYLNNLRFNN
ncbi:non-canonical purine NTP diphosphatase [Aggregatimonas sangjinii]|uniref:dITP/XTP pyrophosphatase n=1 Tax=Aggregatimonas sangjinii TaxID=2583587 RepID=A0A5B7STK1_9FLAO|nr:non-canonical purine NTP diphosphatase [Aggregatimonas sangjinii]QCX00318.1 non-canonical purine NTP diphosphatase [Aggregatimonas sangjinii]